MKYSDLLVGEAHALIEGTVSEMFKEKYKEFKKSVKEKQHLDLTVTGLLVKYIDACDEFNEKGYEEVSSMGCFFFKDKNKNSYLAHFDALLGFDDDGGMFGIELSVDNPQLPEYFE